MSQGSNKIFKLTRDDNASAESSATKANSTQSGLRMNKSLKTLHEDKGSSSLNSSYSTLLKKTVPNKIVDFSEQPPSSNSKTHKYTPSQSLPRSSSASTFEREDPSEKEHKISNINGNIIHVTVNNFIAPLNNVNNIIQPNYMENSRPQSENSKKQDSNDFEKIRVPLNNIQNNEKKEHAKENNELLATNESYNKILNDPNADKST